MPPLPGPKYCLFPTHCSLAPNIFILQCFNTLSHVQCSMVPFLMTVTVNWQKHPKEKVYVNSQFEGISTNPCGGKAWCHAWLSQECSSFFLEGADSHFRKLGSKKETKISSSNVTPSSSICKLDLTSQRFHCSPKHHHELGTALNPVSL